MNILITSAGRQIFLVNAFKDALQGRGKVFASDINSEAPSFTVADESFISPEFTSLDYIPWIKSICLECQIDTIISLNVDDLIVLSEFSDDFAEMNCRLIAGKKENIKRTNDKFKLQDICKEAGLPILETNLLNKNYLPKTSYPLLAKPRYGKGARGNIVLYNFDEVVKFKDSIINSNEEFVIQELIEGVEYGFDIINDFQGNYLSLLGRKKISQKNGESFQAISIDPTFWETEAKKLSKSIQHKGTVNFDVIFSKSVGYLIDVNYRFSGDYVFSHFAGANTPQVYVDCFFNKNIPVNTYIPSFDVVLERIENGAKRI